jgi:hypothetical protein
MSIDEFEAESPAHPNCSCSGNPVSDEDAADEGESGGEEAEA